MIYIIINYHNAWCDGVRLMIRQPRYGWRCV
jgi:hypothetical protein